MHVRTGRLMSKVPCPPPIAACSGSLTCDYKPLGPGRIYLKSSSVDLADGSPAAGPAYFFSDVVGMPQLTPPALSCTSAPRGSEATCTVTGDNVAVSRWRFSNGQDDIIRASSDKVWKG